jgi:hypothetical protein
MVNLAWYKARSGQRIYACRILVVKRAEKRGRPRKTWMEGVRAAMKTRHLEADQWLNGKELCLGSGRQRQLSQAREDR